MKIRISRKRHALGFTAALAFALIGASPARAADSEITRYQTAEKIAKARLPCSTP